MQTLLIGGKFWPAHWDNPTSACQLVPNASVARRAPGIARLIPKRFASHCEAYPTPRARRWSYLTFMQGLQKELRARRAVT